MAADYDYRRRCDKHWPKPRVDEKTKLLVPTDAGFIHSNEENCAACINEMPPTPDKTIDVSKLVSEARAYVDRAAKFIDDEGQWSPSRPYLVPALCDALESVAKERDEKQALYEMTYRQLKLEEAACDEAEAKLAAVAKERDAYAERIERHNREVPKCSICERAALEKLNAK